MGTCVSAHKSSQPSMELQQSMEWKKEGVSVESQTKDNNSTYPVAERGFKSQTSPVLPISSLRDLLNSEEDVFFDSQASLESDSEDFFSINGGDFTPSQGTSPTHQSGLLESPAHHNSLLEDKPQPNPIFESSPTTDAKKKLLEFFRGGVADELTNADEKLATASAGFNENLCAAVQNSGRTSETTPNRRARTDEVNLAASAGRSCFPSLVRSLSISKRRQLRPSLVQKGTA